MSHIPLTLTLPVEAPEGVAGAEEPPLQPGPVPQLLLNEGDVEVAEGMAQVHFTLDHEDLAVDPLNQRPGHLLSQAIHLVLELCYTAKKHMSTKYRCFSLSHKVII